MSSRVGRGKAVALAAVLGLSAAGCGGSSVTEHRIGQGPLAAPGAPVLVGHVADPGESVSFTEPPLVVAAGGSATVERVVARGDEGLEVIRTGVIELPPDYEGLYYAIEDRVIPAPWQPYLHVSPSSVEVPYTPGAINRYFLYVEARLRPGYERGRLTELRVRYEWGGREYELITDHVLLLCKRPGAMEPRKACEDA